MNREASVFDMEQGAIQSRQLSSEDGFGFSLTPRVDKESCSRWVDKGCSEDRSLGWGREGGTGAIGVVGRGVRPPEA